jgi:hypothetical protein
MIELKNRVDGELNTTVQTAMEVLGLSPDDYTLDIQQMCLVPKPKNKE